MIFMFLLVQHETSVLNNFQDKQYQNLKKFLLNI